MTLGKEFMNRSANNHSKKTMPTLHTDALPRRPTTILVPDALIRVTDFLDSDLRDLCLVSREVCAVIQPLIHYRLVLLRERYKSGCTPRQIPYGDYLEYLERSPYLAFYPRQVTMYVHPDAMEDLFAVLSALTGTNVQAVCVVVDGAHQLPTPPPFQEPLEKFLRGTSPSLSVTIAAADNLSSSTLEAVKHLAIQNTTFADRPSFPMVETMRYTTPGSWGAPTPAFGLMPRLTHLMIDWERAQAMGIDPLIWYEPFGATLAAMPNLELLTVLVYAWWGPPNNHASLRAYADTIQQAVFPRRLSLEWRFATPLAGAVESYVRCLGGLRGWHTIAFQIPIEWRAGGRVVGAARDTLLRDSSHNRHVRIDEVHRSENWLEQVNRCTLLTKRGLLGGDGWDVARRSVHEDVAPDRLPITSGPYPSPPNLEPYDRAFEVEQIWV